ncbi:MAG: adenosylcobinamide-GDP ribazoletransferase [Firmicutes bacterium]|nr:adenosylcobinamide-GDP ribazoletransferase [Bacillota bacterium]
MTAGAPGAGPVKRTPAQWAVSQWRSFSQAASFLTALPFRGAQEQAPDFTVSRTYFPLVGLLAGLGMAAADAAVGGLGLRWHATAHAAGAAAALLASAWITGHDNPATVKRRLEPQG